MYVELKSSHNDSGPARIGPTALAAGSSGSRVSLIAASRDPDIVSHLVLWWISGGLIGLISLANYYCVETGEQYWISGPKRLGGDRHWAGSGPIEIDPDVAEQYWREIRQCDPPANPYTA